jgi:hypothetical protein
MSTEYLLSAVAPILEALVDPIGLNINEYVRIKAFC